MTTLTAKQVTELLKEDEKPKVNKGAWSCSICGKWTTSQEGAKYHVCEGKR